VDTDNRRMMARALVRKALKELEGAARLLDTEDTVVIQRLRSASRDAKRAEADLR